MAANPDRLKAFDDALKYINSKTKSETGLVISKLGDTPQKIETVSSGSLVLNSILGGGFGKGRVIEIYGAESSGKTTFALTTAANVQAQGGNVAFIDFEHALDPSYATKLGVDVPNLALAQPEHAEQGLQLIEDLAGTGAVDLIIVDSVAALVPKAEVEGDMEQQTIGLVARLLSRSLKKLVGTANRNNCTVIFINQIREAIGTFSPMGTPTTTTGGRALRFYATQRVEIKSLEQIKEGKEIIGRKTRLTVRKNKLAPPFLQGETVITFGAGINRVAEMVEVGPEHGVIDRPTPRKWAEAATGEVFANSKAEALEKLQEDHELYERLAAHLERKLAGDIEDGTAFKAAPEAGDDDDED